MSGGGGGGAMYPSVICPPPGWIVPLEKVSAVSPVTIFCYPSINIKVFARHFDCFTLNMVLHC